MAWWKKRLSPPDRFIRSAEELSENRLAWEEANLPLGPFDDALSGAQATVIALYGSIEGAFEAALKNEEPESIPDSARLGAAAFLQRSQSEQGARQALVAAFGTLLSDVILVNLEGESRQTVVERVIEIFSTSGDSRQDAIIESALADVPSQEARYQPKRLADNATAILEAGGAIPITRDDPTDLWLGLLASPSIKFGRAIMVGLSWHEAQKELLPTADPIEDFHLKALETLFH